MTRSSANASRSHWPSAKMAHRPTNKPRRMTRFPTLNRSRLRRWSCPTPTSRASNADQVVRRHRRRRCRLPRRDKRASNTDFYSFTAPAGTVINFQLMSAALTRSVAPAGTAPNEYNQGPFDTTWPSTIRAAR